jgi:hypothetical protein
MWSPARYPTLTQVPTQAAAPARLNVVNVTGFIPQTPQIIPLSSRSPTMNRATTTTPPP